MKTGQLGLTIREKNSTRQSSVAHNLRAVNAWLDSLPIANTGESAKQMYQYLLDLNSSEVGVEERLNITLALLKSTTLITDALRKHYIGQSVSLNDKQRKIAALAQAMQSELAIGFKTIIEDMLSEQHNKIQTALLVPAIYHAIGYLSSVLVRCYQLYSQHPGRIWRELHTLFVFAEQNALQHHPIANVYNCNTIALAYYRILITAAANPYQLRQREIEQVFDASAELAHRFKFLSYDANSPLMIVDLDGDSGPQSSGQMSAKTVGQFRQLELSDILTVVQDELRSSGSMVLGNAKSAVQQLGAPLLRHLVKTFANQASRSFSRTPAHGTLRIAVGLSATHFLLSGSEPYVPDHNSAPSDDLSAMEGSLRNVTLVDDGRSRVKHKANAASHDPFVRLYRTKTPEETKQKDLSTRAANHFTQNAEVSYDYQVAALINISPGGYCLAMRGMVPVQTQTGEVVGIVEVAENNEQHWNIGSIRWMKRLPDGALHLGVQLIAPSAQPVMTQVRSSQTLSNSYQRALLLPALKGIGQPATLITSSIPYSVKNKVRIKNEDKVYDVQLNKLIAATASYRQFQFSEALAGTEDEKPTDKPVDLDNFDNLWELL